MKYTERIKNNAGSAPQARLHSPRVGTLRRGPLAPPFSAPIISYCSTAVSARSRFSRTGYLPCSCTYLSPKLVLTLIKGEWDLFSAENFLDVDGMQRFLNSAFSSLLRSKCPLVHLINSRYLQGNPSKTESTILPLPTLTPNQYFLEHSPFFF